jgi:alkylhydroperoxidase family enzyme
MALVDPLDAAVLPEDEQYPNLAREVRAAAHAPSLLEHLRDDTARCYADTALGERRALLVGAAATMATDGDVAEYADRLRVDHGATDEQLVELSGTVADVAELARLAVGTMAGDVPLFTVGTVDETPLLSDVESTLGFLPRHYRLLATDPEALRRRWERDRTTLCGPNAVDRRYAALGAAVALGSDYAVRFFRRLLGERDEPDEQVLDAVRVAAHAASRSRWRASVGVDDWPGRGSTGSADGTASDGTDSAGAATTDGPVETASEQESPATRPEGETP